MPIHDIQAGLQQAELQAQMQMQQQAFALVQRLECARPIFTMLLAEYIDSLGSDAEGRRKLDPKKVQEVSDLAMRIGTCQLQSAGYAKVDFVKTWGLNNEHAVLPY